MRSTLRILLILALLSIIAASSHAQIQTGTPPYGSFSGGPDIVNLGSNNVHIAVPVRSKPGRGTNFPYNLTYDSSVWQPLTSGGTTSWQPTRLGWTGVTPITAGYVTYQSYSQHCRFFQETQWNHRVLPLA
jgi:hypothetical protein